jgi:DNA repair protein RadC
MTARKVKTEDSPVYLRPVADTGDDIIEKAKLILQARVCKGAPMTSPATVKDYLILRAAGLRHEVFSVLFLDAQHRVIACESMFSGTLTQTSVYPREIVKRALELNAGAVILSHNHPSGMAEPSRADEFLTQTLKAALALVDVRILDHVITAGGSAVSMAERGLV